MAGQELEVNFMSIDSGAIAHKQILLSVALLIELYRLTMGVAAEEARRRIAIMRVV
jgi:hypothetical protein